jgi:hypothetical protein
MHEDDFSWTDEYPPDEDYGDESVADRMTSDNFDKFTSLILSIVADRGWSLPDALTITPAQLNDMDGMSGTIDSLDVDRSLIVEVLHREGMFRADVSLYEAISFVFRYVMKNAPKE